MSRTERLTMVRVYLTESEHSAQSLLEYLREQGVRGATLLRGIAGFGRTGVMHRADWLAIAGDLPLILEFMDSAEKVEAVLPELLRHTEPGHVLRWPVEVLASD